MRLEAALSSNASRSSPFSPKAWCGFHSTRRSLRFWGWCWRGIFAAFVIAQVSLNGRAEWLAHLAYSTASLPSPARCMKLTIVDCEKMDAAAQTYMQLFAAAGLYPLDRRIRWAPDQFVARYEEVERRHSR